jgi:hypothetical protein
MKVDDKLTPEQRQGLQDELLVIQVRKAAIDLENLEPNGLKKIITSIQAFSTSTLAIIAALIGVITGVLGVSFGMHKAEIAVDKLEVQTIALNNAIHDKQAEMAIHQKNIDSQQLQINDKKAELKSLTTALESMQANLNTSRNAVATLPDSPEKNIIAKQLGHLESNFQFTITDSIAASNPPPSNKPATAPLARLIEELFSSQSAVRIKAYESLLSQYGKNTDLVPALLDYSNTNMSNENGVYNALVLLSHLNYSALPGTDLNKIRAFAVKAADNGERTKERSLKLLARLPK